MGDFMTHGHDFIAGKGRTTDLSQIFTVTGIGAFLSPVLHQSQVPAMIHDYLTLRYTAQFPDQLHIHLIPDTHGIDKGPVHVENDGISFL